MKKEDSQLEKHIDSFMLHLPTMLDEHEGEWTVFGGEDESPLCFRSSYPDAMLAARDHYGTENTFLVRQVDRDYTAFGRNGRPETYYKRMC